jgi:hypothetical protein
VLGRFQGIRRRTASCLVLVADLELGPSRPSRALESQICGTGISRLYAAGLGFRVSRPPRKTVCVPGLDLRHQVSGVLLGP